MRQWKVVAILLGAWLCIVLYITNSVPSDLDAASRTERSLSQALEDLDLLYKQNKKLLSLLAQFRNDTWPVLPHDSAVQNLASRLQKAGSDLSQITEYTSPGLTFEGEKARRKAENTARELWYFLESQFKKVDQYDGPWDERISKLKKDLDGYKQTMNDDFDRLRKVNKAEDYRLQKSKDLGDLVQRRLEYIQNPDNCRTAKKVVCNLHKGCGFGCQIHHLTYCLIVAYAMGRTLILDSKGWRYSPKGWESVFEPLSQTCTDDHNDWSRTPWGSSVEAMNKYNIIDLPIVDSLNPRPKFMPLAVPSDLAHELSIFHGDPPVWWIGQFVRYLFRLRPKVLKDVINAGRTMGFNNTIVGVHVRRTDKIDLEAAYHSIEEYMSHVKEYYNQLARTQTIITRRVYLATDDPSVLAEAQKQYPDYTFISDRSISQSASLGTRYSDSSLRGIIIDIYYLARCDYLVCTFSSQVCRVAYEIMQTLHGDASKKFRSLDDIFYYGGQNAHEVKAVEEHHGDSKDMLDLLPGDVIGIAGNHWDGYSKGYNQRTRLSGLFPSYKTDDLLVSVQMPTYPEVPHKRS